MLTINIFNETKLKVPKSSQLRRFCRGISSLLFKDNFPYTELEIVLVSQQKISHYNRRYLKRSGSTDIISFPNANPEVGPASLGTLMICPKYVDRYREDIFEVISHGLLHLAGYDHESDQNLWNKQLNRLKYGLPKI